MPFRDHGSHNVLQPVIYKPNQICLPVVLLGHKHPVSKPTFWEPRVPFFPRKYIKSKEIMHQKNNNNPLYHWLLSFGSLGVEIAQVHRTYLVIGLPGLLKISA